MERKYASKTYDFCRVIELNTLSGRQLGKLVYLPRVPTRVFWKSHFAPSSTLMAALNRKYVCLPEYECICRPRGKAVSESTMLNHRRAANKKRTLIGMQLLPRGPVYSKALEVLRHYDKLYISLEHEEGSQPGYGGGEQSMSYPEGLEGGNHFDGPVAFVDEDENAHRSGHDGTHTNNRSNHNGVSTCDSDGSCFNYMSDMDFEISGSGLEGDGRMGEAPNSDSRDINENEIGAEAVNPSGEHSLTDDFDSELDEASIEGTSFHEWAEKNKKWIDLYLRHGLEHAVMDDILETACLGYKSWKTAISHLKKDTGLQSALEYNSVCPGHMCYVHDSLEDDETDRMVCSECGNDEPVPESANTLRMGYIPLLPRLRAMVRDPSNCDSLFSYSKDWTSNVGWKTDVFDGDLFKRIREDLNIIDDNSYDVYIGVSTDGFEVFQKGSCDVWPIIGIIYNLSPDKRFRMQNILPFSFVPGPKEPKNLQSFLLPLILELERINEGGGTKMRFPDGSVNKVRVHLLWFTGDLPAVAKVGGLVGHNGKSPCRFCLQIGYYLVSSNRYYFPSQVMADNGNDQQTFNENVITLCHLTDSMSRTEDHTLQVLEKLESLRGGSRDELRRDTGIREDSVLFRLPTMFRYSSFPIDTMHLFYNVSRRMLEEFVLEGDEFYSLSRASVSRVDEELELSGASISSQLGSRPRKLSLFKDWKAAEHKDFLLSYSLVFFDGYLSDECLEGWAKFVSIVDICLRPEIEESDIESVHRLVIEFLEHFEMTYYRYEHARLGKCKYVIHLLKHLAENLQNCGPLVNCSQLWVERYIGWVKNRLSARHMAPAALFNNAVAVEAYKMYFREPFREEKISEGTQADAEGLEIHGPHMIAVLSNEKETLSPRFIRMVLDYLQRKFVGMTRAEAETVFSYMDLIQESSRVKFLCGSQVLTVGSYSRYGSPARRKVKDRAKWYIAAEMDESETSSDIYYGRLMNIYTLRLKQESVEQFSTRWSQWKAELRIGVFDWVTGLEIGKHGQVYKSTEARNAFSAPTVEDLSIIRRLISVVDHVAPNANSRSQFRGNSARSMGRKRCYFIDGEASKDQILKQGRSGRDGIDRNLRGILRRYDM